MLDISLPKYDHARDTIKNMKKNKRSWDEIFLSYEQLKLMGVLNEDITRNIWLEIIEEMKRELNKSKFIEQIDIETTIVSRNEDNEAEIPRGQGSSWQLYKKKLLDKGWRKEAVEQLEKSTIKLLRKLNMNTRKTGPVKGLVIGQVQSGKTSSMAGLMAMASDWGWNFFVVLSGMVENLRKQTQERLIDDLKGEGNNNWFSLHHLSRRSPHGSRLQDLNVKEGSNQRFLTVCLKNSTRLRNLIQWLEADKNKLKQLRILIIDDEADQASINTKNVDEDERTKINELIIELVNIGRKTNSQPKSVNYVCYTATPYSNFLNESAPESLYPRDFIGMLPVSNDYFGPKQIFGLEDSDDYDGLDIIREISPEDVNQIKEVQEGNIFEIPASLQKSICWFLCAAASMRHLGYKKPVSMLVHTSQRQIHHANLSRAITEWFKNTSERKIIKLCRNIYQQEIRQFTIQDFREGFKEYPVPDNELNNYPYFEEIEPLIREIVKEKISHIRLNEEGELQYHNGIHLCIDNSANNYPGDENVYIRLAYPSKEKLESIEKAPIFIVVGGSTLSRGLTIEGLVSTYFLRAAAAADSLMQMGRWFGYRKGYELFPRIWMTRNTYEKFRFLTALDEELRRELEQFALDQKSPSEYGPRIKNTPSVSWLRITARNKMQKAEEIEMDFSGASIQTIHFENNAEILRKNISVTENFLLNYCGEPKVTLAKSRNALVYKGVKFENIKNHFLLKMSFNKRSRVFNNIDLFCEWFEKVQDEIGFSDWNVIVSGSGKVVKGKVNHKDKWYVETFSVGKVSRSAKYSEMNYSKNLVNIGVLRAPGDVFADIEDPGFFEDENMQGSVSKRTMMEIRKKYGLDKTPQLIIYRIKKDSKARESTDEKKKTKRKDLDFDEDIIGVYINIPGDTSSRSYAKALTVKMEHIDDEDDE